MVQYAVGAGTIASGNIIGCHVKRGYHTIAAVTKYCGCDTM